MQVKYELVLGFILFFISINVNSEVQFSNANANAKFCNTNDIEKHLEDKKIKLLEINLEKHRKWVKNYLKIIKSTDQVISKEYKINYKADIKIIFDNNLECSFNSKIRISGDLRDHIENNIPPITSLDIELLNGNIDSVIKFKLLLPATRNYDNEIFIATFLRHLGFISPKTFYVNSLFNGTKYKFIFQENPAKELLERNQKRESLILKGNETYAWNSDEFKEKFVLAKAANRSWIKKGISNLQISKEATSMLNKVFLKNINIASNQIASYRDLDLEILSSKDSLSRKKNQEYIALLYALHAEHGLVINNRRFYYDPIYNSFSPIYYDGNANILHKILKNYYKNTYYDNKILRHNGDGIFVDRQPVTPNEIIGSKSALLLIEKLDIQNFHKDLTSFGIKISNDELNSVLNIIKFNLERVSLIDAVDINQKYQQNFIDLENNNIELVFDTDKTLSVMACNFQLSLCNTFDIDIDDYANLIGGKLKNKFGLEYLYVGGSIEQYISGNNFNKVGHKKLIIENEFELDIFGPINITVDQNTRIININQESIFGRVLVKNGVINNWHIIFNGFHDNGLNLVPKFDENLLTGCLTIADSSLEQVSVSIDGSVCEDGLNLLRVNGRMNNIKIYDSLHDALDLDYSHLWISNIEIKNAGNDCLDLSAGESSFSNLNLNYCEDKAISLGEESRSNFNNVEINNSKIGIEIKDSSKSIMSNVKIKNTPICVNAFNKKQEFWGGIVEFNMLECIPEVLNVQKGSLIKVNYEL